MVPVLQAQMDAYALMKARQGIAREIVETRASRKRWREVYTLSAGDKTVTTDEFLRIFRARENCNEIIFTLRELAAHQFSHAPTIPPSQYEDV